MYTLQMILIRIKMLKLNLITIFLLCINFESPVHACTGDVVCIFPESYSRCHRCVLTDYLECIPLFAKIHPNIGSCHSKI